MLIKIENTPHISTISAPHFNISITSYAAKRFSTDFEKTVYMLKLLAQVMEKGT